MKYYYYVNFDDSDVTNEGNEIIVPLNGKSFSKIKVLNASFTYDTDVYNPVLKLDTFSGNGFTTDRKGVALCMFDNLTKITDTQWRYNTTYTPEYHISPTLNHLRMYVADGSTNVLSPNNYDNLQLILELDDDKV